MALSTNRTLITQTGINTHQVLNVGGLDSAGIATFLNFKTGESNVHSIGFDVVSSTGAGVTIRSTGNAAFSGIVTAQKFVGDISEATGAAAGLGTALSQTQTDPLNKIYYTDKVLSISTTQTIDHPATANLAYTQYGDIKIEDGHDLIIKDGDDFKYDILGISTTKLARNEFANGLSGDLTGNVTGNVTGNLTGTASTSTNSATAYAIDSAASLNTSGIITATTFVDNNGTISAYGPAFRAYLSSYQVLSNATSSVIIFQSDSGTLGFDTDNCYNTSNGRFTPNRAGYYLIKGQLQFSQSTGNYRYRTRLYKNGSDFCENQSWNDGSNSELHNPISTIVSANGSSDYFQIVGEQHSGGNITITASNSTFFEAHFIRPL